jgi:hypothetical protein
MKCSNERHNDCQAGNLVDARIERSARWTRAAANRWFDAVRERLRRRFSLGRNCIWGFSALSLRATRFLKHHLIKRKEFFRGARYFAGLFSCHLGADDRAERQSATWSRYGRRPPFLLHARVGE